MGVYIVRIDPQWTRALVVGKTITLNTAKPTRGAAVFIPVVQYLGSIVMHQILYRFTGIRWVCLYGSFNLDLITAQERQGIIACYVQIKWVG